jgi:hypothetical protein
VSYVAQLELCLSVAISMVRRSAAAEMRSLLFGVEPLAVAEAVTEGRSFTSASSVGGHEPASIVGPESTSVFEDTHCCS